MTPTRQLAENFLASAQQLGDVLLVDLLQRDPGLAESVGIAAANGARLVLSLTLGGDESVIELALRDDADKLHRVASIALSAPAQH